MSRIAKAPIKIPSGVEVNIDGQTVSIKATKGAQETIIHSSIRVKVDDGVVKVAPIDQENTTDWAQAGTARALINNMVIGCTEGFQKKLELVGVGYRAKASAKQLELNLGFSHPVVYKAPEGISFETPSQTEILVSGINKQQVGQVSAEIRAFRPPEPYKGKGVRYADEYVLRKEAKKK